MQAAFNIISGPYKIDVAALAALNDKVHQNYYKRAIALSTDDVTMMHYGIEMRTSQAQNTC
jgi:hypothetical protein